MNMKKKLLAAGAACLLLAGGGTAVSVLMLRAPEASPVVSTGMQHLASEQYLAASATVGERISFSPEWFDNAVSGATVSSITVTALPAVTEGVLLLGHGEVSVGQTIGRETLSYLSFTPRDGVKNSCFCFTPSTVEGESGYELVCNLVVTNTVNCCPTGTGSAKAVFTHASLAYEGTLTASDPEGDALYFEVCQYPENGSLSLDAKSGVYVYTPAKDFVGEDSFTWRVQDACGAYSENVTMPLRVDPLECGYLFEDMTDSALHNAALQVTGKRLMSGEAVGGKHYFHPDRALSRAAFVAVLLEAAEIDAPDADSTGYQDDADIPRGMKGAVLYAKEKGWLGDEECFRPHDAITRAEAAEIAAAVLGLGAPSYKETVADFSTIPVDVADAIYAIYEGGYIETLSDGTLAPQGELSRGDAARFFSRILEGKS